MTCFKCGKVGYMARNCKEPVLKANVLRIVGASPPPAQTVHPRARMFNMTIKDIVQDADVVACTLAINLVEVKVLMDSGATRSFISESVVDRLKCVTYPLESNLVIEVANQARVTVDRNCPNYDILREGRHFSAELILFKLGEFDVILGMDWLVNHDAQIECRSKKVKLRTEDGTEDMEKESQMIEDIPVVKEFPDVFLDEIPGLPPDPEIEFTIDLAYGTEPISKAPYELRPLT
ncbi:uncharacterized protein LOC141685156 [Apium graveolens]|uniref:uncharacterized protein LOC141685156 n=1 Tax=Apium graveolens TaxID=4045 RepID=UPI003D7B6E5A